jgi:hypothetical protein
MSADTSLKAQDARYTLNWIESGNMDRAGFACPKKAVAKFRAKRQQGVASMTLVNPKGRVMMRYPTESDLPKVARVT